MSRYWLGLVVFILGCTAADRPPADLAADLTVPDGGCWLRHQCVNPTCCDPVCAPALDRNAPCPFDPCQPGDYCTYFESYCQCGADKHWTYKNTGVTRDLASPAG